MTTWEEINRDILSRLNIEEFYTSRGIKISSRNADQISGLCTLHDDHSNSFSFNLKTGLFKCFVASCSAFDGGSVFDFEILVSGSDFRTAQKKLAELTGIDLPEIKPPIPEGFVTQYHEAFLLNQDLRDFFHTKRGISLETLRLYKIGWNGDRVTIPIYDENNLLRNIRLYKHKIKSKTEKKFLNFEHNNIKYGEARLFNLNKYNKEANKVIFCEGELDCIVLAQAGFNALTATSGAGTFSLKWIPHFKNKKVWIVFDNDKAGEVGAIRIAGMLNAHEIECYICQIPVVLGPKADVTDFFINGGTADSFESLIIKKARKFEIDISKSILPTDSIETSLGEIGKAEYVGKRITCNVLVSGKDTTPFIVPLKCTASCPTNRGNVCFACGMLARGGSADIEFKASDKEIIAFTNTSDIQIENIIRTKLSVIKCPVFKLDITERQNIEEVRLIPSIDEFSNFSKDDNTQYVHRIVYNVKDELQSNRSYDISGIVHSDPRTQYATMILDHAVPAQDNISGFKMTESIFDELKIFQCPSNLESVKEKVTHICNDLSSNVYFIYNRHEMQIAMDLVWHSMIGFHFNGRPVRKGWAECLILSDSGQGKSDTSIGLLNHYQVGERFQMEHGSIAGIIGGVEQIQGRWVLTWGKLPANDRRVLVVEELGSVDTEYLAKLTDVRSSGIAEITKMRTERTNARVRLIFLSNPRNDKPVITYNYGIEAVLELFGGAADVRRLDFAIVLSSGEVSEDVLNAKVSDRPRVEHIYTSDKCKNLVLWAWSRRPEQVIFNEQVTEAILEYSKQMSRKYSYRIPLVEPGDQRIKLARLSAALAARLFSTDDGENVIVQVAHAEFVFNFLSREYDKASMGYKDFSKHDFGYLSSDNKTAEIAENIKTNFREDYKILCEQLVRLKFFRKTTLTDAMGWDKDKCRIALKNLIEWGCIRSSANGFEKVPSFNAVLKQILNNGTNPVRESQLNIESEKIYGVDETPTMFDDAFRDK